MTELPAENCEELSKALAETRHDVRNMLQEILASHDFSAPFHDKEVEDIIFYQIAHGIPVH